MYIKDDVISKWKQKLHEKCFSPHHNNVTSPLTRVLSDLTDSIIILLPNAQANASDLKRDSSLVTAFVLPLETSQHIGREQIAGTIYPCVNTKYASTCVYSNQ
jgi:hypothetical protein